MRCVLHDDEPFIEPQERQSERVAAAAEAKEEEATAAKEAKKKGLGTLYAFFPKTQVQQCSDIPQSCCVLTCHTLAHALAAGCVTTCASARSRLCSAAAALSLTVPHTGAAMQ